MGSIPIARSTFRLASGPVRTRDRGQRVDLAGKRWERTLTRRRSRVLTYPRVAPQFTRTVTRGEFEKIMCVIPTLFAPRQWRLQVAGLDPQQPFKPCSNTLPLQRIPHRLYRFQRAP